MQVEVARKIPWAEWIPGRLRAAFLRTVKKDEPTSSRSGAPSDEEIRTQLDEIVNSPLFETSARNRRFLQYIVNETLAGNSNRIKAYSVATMVFQRDANFDPQADPIIRIEASRLRRALDHYYLGAGRSAPVRISVPKGSYVPTFSYAQGGSSPAEARRENGNHGASEPDEASRRPARLPRLLVGAMVFAAAATAIVYFTLSEYPGPDADKAISSSGAAQRGIPVAVAPFQFENAPAAGAALSGEHLAQRISGELIPFSNLRVLAASKDKSILEPGYLLEGGGAYLGNELRLWTRLVQIKSGQQVWSGKFNLQSDQSTRIDDEAVGRIVRAVAGGNGAIVAHEAREIAAIPVKHTTPAQCVLRFQLYQRQPTAVQLAECRACLERAVQIDPGYAAAHAALAIVRIEPIRWRIIPRAEWPALLGSALTSARRALDLAPRDPLAFQALHHVQWLNGHVEQSIAFAEQAHALNPNDAQLTADLGFRYGMLADWARAAPLLEQAYAEDPQLSSIYRSVLVLRYYSDGRYEQALAEAKKVDLENFVYAHVLLAISSAKLGLREKASASVAKALALEPRLAQQVQPDLLARNVHPQLVAAIVDGLEAAGLQVPGRR